VYSSFRVLKLSFKKAGGADGSTCGSWNVVEGAGHIAASGRAGGADRWGFCADGSTQLDQPRRSPVFSKHTSEDRLEVIADLAGPELTDAVLPNLLAYESAPGCSGVDWRS